jgi:hypothetical protein
MGLSGWVIAAFLSHWSLLDGAPRNSLQMFLDGRAHRPYAHRVLAPALVRQVDALLPASFRALLADQVAPVFRSRFVDPLLVSYERILPGVTERAGADWRRAEYRRRYVLMVLLMFGSMMGALLLVRRSAVHLGANPTRATAVMTLYAVIIPTMFLNGGYFYDLVEQLGAATLIFCVLRARWALAALVLVLMQANKETAILMLVFLAPLAWGPRGRPAWPWAALAFVCCVGITVAVLSAHAQLPGQPMAWHLGENLPFWSTGSSWLRTEDFHRVGVALPRMTFLVFALTMLALGWRRGSGALVAAATVAFVALAALLVCLGFRDEFRNLSLAAPLLVLLAAGRPARA